MQGAQVFRPETISRQGERNAWILTGFAVVITLVMTWRFSAPPAWITILTFFLLLSAILISLSNWVDRQTILVLKPDKVQFRNGLRNIHLDWEQIEKVSVTTDRWGDLVHVRGLGSSFKFRLLSEVEFQGKVRGQMGFPEGEAILKSILQSSGLNLTESNNQGRYYARP